MKRILITGAGSYIGTSVENYLRQYNAVRGEECYRIDTVSMLDDGWKTYDFSGYDTIFHVAGIAHADVGNVSKETEELYYRVNCDLALETASKAAAEGVGQFIYMSSVIVYGQSFWGKRMHITGETPLMPANFYGDSKRKAEEALFTLESETFRVAVLRPPMIYGPGCRGNYPLLSKMAGKLPVFPDICNERSMLYIENLAEFVRRLADSGRGGVFFPQNREYVSTSQLVNMIAKARGKKLYLWKILNPLVAIAARMPGKIGGIVKKAFGSMTIDLLLSRKDFDGYQVYSLEESIRKTEKGE